MKRRLTSIAAVLVLADVLLLGAAWHLGPVLSLTAALAAPHVEPLLAPLYAEPAREDVAVDVDGAPVRARLYRPSTPHRSLVLVPDGTRDRDAVETLARILARRGLTVLVPASMGADPAALRAYTTALGMPNDVAPVSRFEPSEGAPSAATRAAHAWRIFNLSRTLLEDN